MSRRGLTLIELLVAASLFLMAVVTFSYLLKIGATSVNSASNLNQAVCALQAKMEEIHPLAFSQLPPLNGSSFAKGTGKISVMPVLADLVKIQLELQWDPKRGPLKLTTLRSKY